MEKDYIASIIEHLEGRYPEGEVPAEITAAIRRMKAAYEREARLRSVCALEGLRLPHQILPVAFTLGASRRHIR